MIEIRLPDDYPDGERFNRTKAVFEKGGLRKFGFSDYKVKADIYTWQMAALFGFNNDDSHDAHGKPISQFKLLEAYYKGFTKGKEKFEKLYPSQLFFADQKSYVETLHHACFHLDPISGENNKRWCNMINTYPYQFTSFERLEEFGFYAGLYSGVLEMKRTYSAPFASLEDCPITEKDNVANKRKAERSNNPRTTKRNLDDLTADAVALIHVFINEPITTENRNDIAPKYLKPDGNPYSPAKLYTTFLKFADKQDRERQKPSPTLFNHYRRCINWLKSKGLKIAEKTAIKELQELQQKQLNR